MAAAAAAFVGRRGFPRRSPKSLNASGDTHQQPDEHVVYGSPAPVARIFRKARQELVFVGTVINLLLPPNERAPTDRTDRCAAEAKEPPGRVRGEAGGDSQPETHLGGNVRSQKHAAQSKGREPGAAAAGAAPTGGPRRAGLDGRAATESREDESW